VVTSTDLRFGERDEAVRDLQRRLMAHGFDLHNDEPGHFGDATAVAVRSFQEVRGLRVDGVCGAQTWSALVESGRVLGDRLLYLRVPMLRGDDVRTLQRRLNALGFDAGREDGILGEETAEALGEFQRNAGIAVDGICGPATLDALDRLGSFAAGSVATVRERESLRRGPHALGGRRVFVAVSPGLAALGEATSRELRDRGADALLDAGGAGDAALAVEADRFGAELCVAIRTGTEPGFAVSYFGTSDFRSELGWKVANAIQEKTGNHLAVVGCAPKTYPFLRETRMAAVLCELDPAPRGLATIVANTGALAQAIADGIRRAVEEPAEQS